MYFINLSHQIEHLHLNRNHKCHTTFQSIDNHLHHQILYSLCLPAISVELGHALHYAGHNLIDTAVKVNKYLKKTGGIKGESDTLHRHHNSVRKNTRSPYLTSYHVSKAVHTGKNVRITPHHVYTALPYKQTPTKIPISEIGTRAYWTDQWWTGLEPNQDSTALYFARNISPISREMQIIKFLLVYSGPCYIGDITVVDLQ
jgi:hypothetical protein